MPIGNQPLPPVESWRAGQFQLIAFPLEPQAGIEQNWWSDLTGAGADCESVRKKFERTDSGNYRGSDFRLHIELARISWTASPRMELTAASGFADAPPDIGPFLETRDWFCNLMTQWLAGCPAIKRLAFAGKLFQWTADREESYRLVDRYLPGVEVDPEATEFQYRINRVRPSSALPGVGINRLTTWSSVKMQLAMQVSAAGHSQLVEQFHHASMLQFDINTAQDFKDEIPHGSLPALWNELVSLGTEIATLGDIR